jgi:hypothetical protein
MVCGTGHAMAQALAGDFATCPSRASHVTRLTRRRHGAVLLQAQHLACHATRRPPRTV